MLRHSVDNTLHILQRELEIQREELNEQLFFASLEQIFIEERIYKDEGYEQSRSREQAIAHIHGRLDPYKPTFIREITDEDVARLFDIKMGRILRFNAERNEELIASIRARIDVIDDHLAHIIDFTVEWFRNLQLKYGDAYPRNTVIRAFDNIQAAAVAEANEKLMFNREEGFIGTALKKDDKTEIIGPCSSIDDVIIFYRDGRYKIVRIQDKLFVDKDVLFVSVFTKDERTVYNAIYRNGRNGAYFMKRFKVTGITRDREYNLTPGEPGSRILWFKYNPNGEAETVNVTLKPRPRLNRLQIEIDFSSLAIKGRSAMGNLVTKNEIARISLKRKGVSTLGGREVWFDPDVLRLNYDGRG